MSGALAVYTAFNRRMMATVHAEVRRQFPNVRPMRDAWVWHAGRDLWEFHRPDGFHVHFRAEDGYDARAKGWEKWLALDQGPI